MEKSELLSKGASSRTGCLCCSFDLFLPRGESGQEGNNNDISAEEEIPINPQQALESLQEASFRTGDIAPIIIVDTHGHAHLERETDETYDVGDALLLRKEDQTMPSVSHKRVQLKSIICSVEPLDWQTTLMYAATSPVYLPALGIHPWYLGDGLPSGWLSQLESLLLEHPSAIVGEIGLCKMARWTRQYAQGKAAALKIQRDVFQQQLQLAARLRRPVSVHCVNQHGVFVSVLKEILSQNTCCEKDPRLLLPPTIAMHSFTGTAHHANELLTFEKQLKSSRNNADPLFYFGFSHTVNYVMNNSEHSRRKGKEALVSIPSDRVLVESDVHSSKDLLCGTTGAIAYVAWARNESIQHVANVTAQNGMAFLIPVKNASPHTEFL